MSSGLSVRTHDFSARSTASNKGRKTFPTGDFKFTLEQRLQLTQGNWINRPWLAYRKSDIIVEYF